MIVFGEEAELVHLEVDVHPGDEKMASKIKKFETKYCRIDI